MEEKPFKPLLTKDQARMLCKQYPGAEDKSVEKAGSAIRNGDYARENFEAIFKWKTRNRGKSRLERHTDDEIAEALRIATSIKSPKLSIALLCGLSGSDRRVVRRY